MVRNLFVYLALVAGVSANSYSHVNWYQDYSVWPNNTTLNNTSLDTTTTTTTTTVASSNTTTTTAASGSNDTTTTTTVASNASSTNTTTTTAGATVVTEDTKDVNGSSVPKSGDELKNAYAADSLFPNCTYSRRRLNESTAGAAASENGTAAGAGCPTKDPATVGKTEEASVMKIETTITSSMTIPEAKLEDLKNSDSKALGGKVCTSTAQATEKFTRKKLSMNVAYKDCTVLCKPAEMNCITVTETGNNGTGNSSRRMLSTKSVSTAVAVDTYVAMPTSDLNKDTLALAQTAVDDSLKSLATDSVAGTEFASLVAVEFATVAADETEMLTSLQGATVTGVATKKSDKIETYKDGGVVASTMTTAGAAEKTVFSAFALMSLVLLW